MATNFFNFTKHGVCETSSLTSVQVGHVYNLSIDVDMDEGSVCAVGDFVSGDVWSAKIPAVTDELFLVNSSQEIYENYRPDMQEVQYFYNEAGDVVRAYEVKKNDKFALSEECFTDTVAPAVGKYVVVDGTGYQLTVSDTQPTGVAFIGEIYDIATNGNYRIRVLQNTAIAA